MAYVINSAVLGIPAMTTGTGSSYVSAVGASNGINWDDMSTISVTSASPMQNTLHVRGDADFDGDVKLKGVSLKETLDKINDRLAILHPNKELEERWENLRGLRKAYEELEAEIIEKEKIWNILKK